MEENNADTVFLRNLKIVGTHGVYAHERHTEQEFIVDIEARVNTHRAAQSDKLEDTVDYVPFKAIAERIIQDNSYYLVEKIAEVIAQEVLTDKRILQVTVTITKPTVLPNGIPGVIVTRKQPS